MNAFQKALAQSSPQQPLILDGAMGTELNRRGVSTDLPLWSAGALLSAPEVIQQIHLDYLLAGADIITTNTFRTHARNLGSSEQARALTGLAVELAQAARQSLALDRPAWIAGSVAPLEDCYSPQLTPDPATCEREQAALVENLAAAGADLLLLETMNTIHEAAAAAKAAQATGLPFLVSFVLDEGLRLLSGEGLAEAVRALEIYGPSAVMINCIPARHIGAAVAALRPLTALPIGAYGNMGTPDEVQGWASSQDVPPPLYAGLAAAWQQTGAQIIGSCCGSGPAHTQALRDGFRSL
jgi:homocysteine S-methyltransferase